MKSFFILHQDIMISLLGYLAAALGGALAASGFRIRVPLQAAASTKATRPEPVKLSLAKETAPQKSSARQNDLTVEMTESGARRNRLETISLAREMIAKGTSHDRIKRLLPISDGELILLQKTPNRETKR